MAVRMFLAVLLLWTVACSDPKATRVTEEFKEDLLAPVKDQKGLTVDEVRMLLAYQVRQSAAKAFGGTPEDPIGKTLGEIIESQRKFEADAQAKQLEADRLAAEAKAKQDAIAAELSKSIQFTVYDKGFVPKNIYSGRFDDYITFKCAYVNEGTKDIRAFTGRLEFTDLFGKPVFTTSVTISDPVKAGSKGEWDGTLEYNQFNDAHKSLANAELANLKVKWLPTAVIFADGTTIGDMPQ